LFSLPQGYGYLEDRRPAANVDPYTVARLLIKTTLPHLL
jgi:glutamine synthetase